MKNLEIEYKILLTEEKFKDIISQYPMHIYTQINYYFTSKELSSKKYALRIRKKENTYEMTLKTPASIGRHEYNISLTQEDAADYLKGIWKENPITQRLIREGFSLKEIHLFSSLKTIRHDYLMTYGVLSLDKNYYENKIDYELEFEINDIEKGKKQFEELLKKHHLHYNHNCPSKLKRIINAKVLTEK